MSLGSYLRSLRESRQLTLRSIEKESGISNAYLSQLETDKIKKPSPACLYKISKLYGISYDDLMMKAGYPLPDGQEADVVEKTGAASAQRRTMRSSPVSKALSDLTREEEEALLEYLAFLKSRRKSTGHAEPGRAD